ncbi:MAG TPA: TlyA family RNA methyltransferase [Segeticoccus sp.]|uniref:TlyA family RNA methyltransferase n=1 Tax=Segeticoccus sp. TaxID=2706531 RepID=UPI002D81043C|nr:TlyA family RNA methyltransferase [Segeticoccus sp.]HET8601269.1 TlyA family RNA methyltransferase [Segeticoccus sp.]
MTDVDRSREPVPRHRPAQGSDEPRRLDVELVQRGLARSRGEARELVRAGGVRVDGEVVTKASRGIAPHAEVEVHRGERGQWVGRAAYKLLAGLDRFGVDVRGRRCLDVGASTGGFTQVLLERGAREVVAVDVGHGQLAAPVASDPRVRERSGTNVRDLAPGDIGGPADLVVADLSFISLRVVLARLAELTAPDGDLLVLVKPQFEVGRERLGKGGLVRDHRDRRAAVRDVAAEAADCGLHVVDGCPSPIAGGSGNREYLLWLRRGGGGMMSGPNLTRAVEQWMREED